MQADLVALDPEVLSAQIEDGTFSEDAFFEQSSAADVLEAASRFSLEVGDSAGFYFDVANDSSALAEMDFDGASSFADFMAHFVDELPNSSVELEGDEDEPKRIMAIHPHDDLKRLLESSDQFDLEAVFEAHRDAYESAEEGEEDLPALNVEPDDFRDYVSSLIEFLQDSADSGQDVIVTSA